MTHWTREETDMLRRLATVDKLTSGQITRRFGGKFTRSAVIGRLRRENIALARAQDEKTKKLIEPTRPAPRMRTRPKSVSRNPIPEFRPATGEPEPLGLPGQIPDEHDACRWVHGDPSIGSTWRMCAHPAIFRSRFCDHHHFRCYTQIKPPTPGDRYVRGRRT
jgi:hypothetical protein